MSKRFYCARCPMEIAEGDILCAQCCQAENEKLKVKVGELEGENERRKKNEESLFRIAEAKQAEIERLEKEKDELLKEVQAWRERHG